ncbi:hypothetical protein GCM10022398_04020 [Acetobacter lovaniensis]|jgi:hypothetical protein|uniref:Uncharacterized protein n=1 Tax=Acetobacter lovaniensis TaxID=104100 RepID=A0A841QDK9_9PROT|nr:hypothetical protein [Acetobacter lovaniensis]
MKFRSPLLLALACVITGGSVTLASQAHLPTSVLFGWDLFPSPRLSSPIVVTSDSLSFCLELAHLIDSYAATKASVSVSVSVSRLETEGMNLCQKGHIRPGLVRLRRALLNAEGAPS